MVEKGELPSQMTTYVSSMCEKRESQSLQVGIMFKIMKLIMRI